MEKNGFETKDIFDQLVKMDAEFYTAKDYRLSKNSFELSDSNLVGASSIMAPVFLTIANKIGYSGALFAELPKGTHLTAVKDAAGKVWGSISKENNQIAGLAQFSSASPKGADIASAIFTVLAFVTGQYYMNENLKSLNKVNGTIHNLEGHIEAEKYSELCQENETLNNMISDYQYILANEDRLNASRILVTQIIRDTDKNAKYYTAQLTDSRNRFKVAADELTVGEKITIISSNSHKLLFTLYNYGLAMLVEQVLFSITDKEELLKRKDRIQNKLTDAVDMIYFTYKYIDDFSKEKEYTKLLKKEKLSVVQKFLTWGLVPFPFCIWADKGINDFKANKLGDFYKEGLENSKKSVQEMRQKVTPIPMLEDYISLCDMRMVIVAKDDKLYVDYVKEFDAVEPEKIAIDRL